MDVPPPYQTVQMADLTTSPAVLLAGTIAVLALLLTILVHLFAKPRVPVAMLQTQSKPPPLQRRRRKKRKRTSETAKICSLPQELLITILKHLSPADLGRIAQVNRDLHRLSLDNVLWKNHYFTLFGWSSTAQDDTFLSRNEAISWKRILQHKITTEGRWRRGDYAQITLDGHLAAVYAISLDRNFLVSGDASGTVKLWEWCGLKGGVCLSTHVAAHQAAVKCVCLKAAAHTKSHTEKRSAHLAYFFIITGGDDWMVKWWEGGLAIGTPERANAGPRLRNTKAIAAPASVLSLALCPERKLLVLGLGNGSVWLWDTDLWTLRNQLQGHSESVTCVKLGDNIVVSGSEDHTVVVWSLATGHALSTLSGHTSWVRALCIMPHTKRGTVLFSGSPDGTVRQWRAETGEQLLQWEYTTQLKVRAAGEVYPPHCVRCIEIHDWKLVIGFWEGYCCVLDLRTPDLQCVQVLKYPNLIFCMAVSESFLALGSLDGSVVLWDFSYDAQQ